MPASIILKEKETRCRNSKFSVADTYKKERFQWHFTWQKSQMILWLIWDEKKFKRKQNRMSYDQFFQLLTQYTD